MTPLFYSQAQVFDVEHTVRVSNIAQPARWQDVSGRAVLKILNGTYRKAVFGGTFLLDVEATRKCQPAGDGWASAVVYCLWFGRRLKTRGLKIKYEVAGSRVIQSYSGQVVIDLAS
jgi:hypothetical protein